MPNKAELKKFAEFNEQKRTMIEAANVLFKEKQSAIQIHRDLIAAIQSNINEIADYVGIEPPGSLLVKARKYGTQREAVEAAEEHIKLIKEHLDIVGLIAKLNSIPVYLDLGHDVPGINYDLNQGWVSSSYNC